MDTPMLLLEVPNDPDLLHEIAQISICHGQLDYVIKLVFRDLAGLEIEEAIDATYRQGSAEIRRRVKKLAKQRFHESQTLARLDALLNRAAKVTEKHNSTLHPVWAYSIDDGPMVRRDDHTWEKPDLDSLRNIVGNTQPGGEARGFGSGAWRRRVFDFGDVDVGRVLEGWRRETARSA